MCEIYNGWPNYPTWNYSLWMGDDTAWIEEVTNRADDIYELAKLLEENFDQYVEEVCPILFKGNVLSDMFTFATGKIDWYHIAENYWEEYRAEDEVDDKEEEDENE